jgi:hypothetical protein
LLTPVAFLARHTADAVEHAVLGGQIGEPLDVQDITSAKWYTRRTSASVSVVIVISHLGIDQGVSRFTAGTVRGHYRIPVIVESGRRNAGRRT